MDLFSLATTNAAGSLPPAQQVFALPELRTAVPPPDGVDERAWRAAFLVPPMLTTLRLLPPPTPDAADPGPAAALAEVLALAARAGVTVGTMDACGLEDCVVLHAPAEIQRFFAGQPLPVPLDAATVVVDAACGEAVLRGADVFAPGVVACTRHFDRGDPVIVAALVAPEWRTAVAAAADASGGNNAHQVLKGSFATVDTVSRSCVVVGAGVALLSRTECISPKARGVALRVNGANPMRHLPLSDGPDAYLPSVLPASGYRVFLQNWSSLVPVACLRLRPGTAHAVWDVCAAPGGKTSHVLSRLGRDAVASASCARNARRRAARHCASSCWGCIRRPSWRESPSFTPTRTPCASTVATQQAQASRPMTPR